MTEYVIMTEEQKTFLEKMFKCFDINIEDLMGIKNIAELKTENKNLSDRLTLCEKTIIEQNNVIVALSKQVSDISKDLTNMQNEEMVWDK